MLNPERWKRLEEIFYAASPLKQSERRLFLHRTCADDEELRREAESLLTAADAQDDFLNGSTLTLSLLALADEDTWRTTEMSSANLSGDEGALRAGATLDDRYEIVEALDPGGMGEIYKARDLRLDKPVVVKVLKRKSLSNPWIVKKFHDEAKAQSLLQHPGVATVLDKGMLPSGEHYLVMEFVRGTTLRKVIKSRSDAGRRMDFSDVAEIMRQIGRAVAAIHQARMVHRDLKPENIMVNQETGTGDFVVKVIDFGIVRVLDASTVTGQIVGTLSYMSPEQLNGRDVTHASDVYALGAIAYEMLIGDRLFKPESLPQLFEMQKNGLKVMPHALRPELPQEAERVILDALRYDASKREQSAREFGDGLARALSTQPRTARDGFDRWWLAAGAVAVVALVAVVVGFVWWNLSSRTLLPEIVVTSRPEGIAPQGSAAPSADRVYDIDNGFPTETPPQGTIYATIGFTTWRARPATARDGEDTARATIDSQEVASERVGDYVSDGEKLYLSVESLTGEFLPDKGGYLYVINREQFSDGSRGKARLIFPTALTYGGNNRVKPGQPVVLPGQSRPFVVRRSSPAQVAESYTIILSPWAFQLPKPLGERAMELPDSLVADWERQYGGRMFRASLRGGVGQVQTRREQAVGARETIDTAEPLTKAEPLPQIVYRGAVKHGSPALVTVTLRYRD